MAESTWLKAHAMVGVTTNIVTAISVTDSSGADSPQLLPWEDPLAMPAPTFGKYL
jgi:hypothetical protein